MRHGAGTPLLDLKTIAHPFERGVAVIVEFVFTERIGEDFILGSRDGFVQGARMPSRLAPSLCQLP